MLITTVCRLGWQYNIEFWTEREPAFQGWGINPGPKHDCFLALLWLYFKISRKLIFKSLWASHRKKVKLPKWIVLSFSALAWASWEVAALTYLRCETWRFNILPEMLWTHFEMDSLTHWVGKLQIFSVDHADYETVTRKRVLSFQLNPLIIIFCLFLSLHRIYKSVKILIGKTE